MIGYALRRLVYGVIALFGVSVITFLTVFAAGDPTLLILPPGSHSPEEIAIARAALGLDRPLPVQYFEFITRALQGDFGRSLRFSIPSMQLVMERLPNTVLLATSAVVLASVIGIPLGVLSALRKGSKLDDLVVTISSLGLAAPSFWIGTMLIIIFAVHFRWFPPSGTGSWQHLVLPMVTLAAAPIPVLVRFTRAGMIDVLSREYITTAHAKGLHPRTVLYRHALRNTLIPVITILGLEMGALLGGAVVTENVFGWPGIGQLVVSSVTGRDLPVVVTVVMVGSAIFIVANLIVDLLYVYINPTIRVR
ncbi:MAG TPA: ABC transporter permease [Candidatus Limnocylindria bacterium]|nr:ABC transporter permease [Candidatus Limnocylindria bacterium]